MGDVTRVVKEALDGQRVIKVFNAQEQEARDFEKVNEHNRRSNMKLIAAQAPPATRWCSSSPRSASAACCGWRWCRSDRQAT